jgi:hypothetical protein
MIPQYFFVSLLVSFHQCPSLGFILILLLAKGRQERWANLRERDHLENLGIDGKGKLKWIFMKRNGGMDWIYLA